MLKPSPALLYLPRLVQNVIISSQFPGAENDFEIPWIRRGAERTIYMQGRTDNKSSYQILLFGIHSGRIFYQTWLSMLALTTALAQSYGGKKKHTESMFVVISL